jgi:biopolymer transport protein ExbB/TolQ
VFRRERRSSDALKERVPVILAEGDLDSVSRLAQTNPGAASAILLAGLRHMRAGAASMEEHILAARIAEKNRLEERLLILGTLGNNAPFIGLFGTVLGVIQAFRALGAADSADTSLLMTGLSEALIATAVGLFVAIPSVMAFNYFQKRMADILDEAETFVRLLLAHRKDQTQDDLRRGHPAER